MKKLLLISLLALSLSAMGGVEAKQNYKVKWVLAHEPIGLFKEAAEVFSKDVALKTNGKVTFEILTIPEYELKYNSSKKISYGEFLKKVQSGEIEMSQTYTTDLGRLDSSLYVLDLPFLFRDHSHASKVLEGEIGNKLLASLSKFNLRGLAFTYSGGYRIIPGTKKINRLEDFKGIKIRTSSSPIAQDTFNLLGAKAIPMDLKDIENGISSGKIDEAESTYARYFTLGQNH
jgi:TRAP-type C4-dicarboxylate transport system substrate-binding protein